MKKTILCILFSTITTPVFSDILYHPSDTEIQEGPITYKKNNVRK